MPIVSACQAGEVIAVRQADGRCGEAVVKGACQDKTEGHWYCAIHREHFPNQLMDAHNARINPWEAFLTIKVLKQEKRESHTARAPERTNMMDEESRKHVAGLEKNSRFPTGIGRIEQSPYGHMLECHYPFACEEVECSHYEQEMTDEEPI